ncbi:hypothetical protein F4821DRAFT_257021 [Hypoxylon rubiginosum]|uniref:Uncharacterized protein n=1 Tax=Hypoxylon rubiginosum TaxID=110542 RepID=A0ACC0D9M8_9PEZI|nr:hypothetical protein F4821DRAFT_257021 [Hypoxylon rubiginosum]
MAATWQFAPAIEYCLDLSAPCYHGTARDPELSVTKNLPQRRHIRVDRPSRESLDSPLYMRDGLHLWLATLAMVLTPSLKSSMLSWLQMRNGPEAKGNKSQRPVDRQEIRLEGITEHDYDREVGAAVGEIIIVSPPSDDARAPAGDSSGAATRAATEQQQQTPGRAESFTASPYSNPPQRTQRGLAQARVLRGAIRGRARLVTTRGRLPASRSAATLTRPRSS